MKKLPWEENPQITGETLVTFKGKILITANMLKLEEERILDEEDYNCLSFALTEGFANWDRNILEYMIIDKIVNEYITEYNVNNPISYYDALQIEDINISDSQAKTFYDTEILKGQIHNQSPEEIKHILKALKVQLSKKKRLEALKEKIQKLKKKYEVVVNEDYFEPKK